MYVYIYIYLYNIKYIYIYIYLYIENEEFNVNYQCKVILIINLALLTVLLTSIMAHYSLRPILYPISVYTN